MALTWTAPLATPTGLAASVSAGGSLPASTTYYIRVIARVIEARLSNVGADQRISSPCAEVSVTTDATNKTLNISWNAVAGASYYDVHITKNGSATNRWKTTKVGRISDGSEAHATTNLTSLSFTAETRMFKNDNHPFVVDTTLSIIGNLDRELGTGKLDITGVCGNITEADLVAAIPSTHCFYDGGQLVILGDIIVAGGATGNLTFSNGLTICPLYGNFYNAGTGFYVIARTCNIALARWSVRLPLKNWTIKNTTFRGSAYTPVPYTTYVWGGDNYVLLDDGTTDEGGNLFLGVIVQCDDPDGTYQDFNVVGALIGNSTNSYRMTILRATCTYFWIRISNYKTSDAFIVRDCTMNNNGYQIRVYYAWTDPFPIYDPTFIYTGITDNNRPKVWWSYSDGYSNQIDIFRSFNISLIDEKNITIQNAEIKLVDKNGNIIFTETTDSNGQITSQDVKVTEITKTSGGGVYDSDYNDLSPFTLEIRKSGFKTYISKFTLSKAFDEIITLQQIKDLNFSKKFKVVTQ